MKNYNYEINKLPDGDIQVFGDRIFIIKVTDKLNDLGYDVGQTISDWRESRLYTNAPMDIVDNTVKEIK